MNDLNHKPVSSLAVCSMVFGLIAILGIAIPVFLFALLLSVPLGIAAIFSIRKHDLNGTLPSILGIVVAMVFAIGTPARHYLEYRFESPLGYQRLDFNSLIASGGIDLDKYLGESICLKGYPMIPRDWKESRLVGLTPDGNMFRGETLVVVEISLDEWQLKENQSISVSGTLVRFQGKGNSEYGPKYLLKQSTIRQCKTRYDLADFNSGWGC